MNFFYCGQPPHAVSATRFSDPRVFARPDHFRTDSRYGLGADSEVKGNVLFVDPGLRHGENVAVTLAEGFLRVKATVNEGENVIRGGSLNLHVGAGQFNNPLHFSVIGPVQSEPPLPPIRLLLAADEATAEPVSDVKQDLLDSVSDAYPALRNGSSLSLRRSQISLAVNESGEVSGERLIAHISNLHKCSLPEYGFTVVTANVSEWIGRNLLQAEGVTA